MPFDVKSFRRNLLSEGIFADALMTGSIVGFSFLFIKKKLISYFKEKAKEDLEILSSEGITHRQLFYLFHCYKRWLGSQRIVDSHRLNVSIEGSLLEWFTEDIQEFEGNLDSFDSSLDIPISEKSKKKEQYTILKSDLSKVLLDIESKGNKKGDYEKRIIILSTISIITSILFKSSNDTVKSIARFSLLSIRALLTHLFTSKLSRFLSKKSKELLIISENEWKDRESLKIAQEVTSKIPGFDETDNNDVTESLKSHVCLSTENMPRNLLTEVKSWGLYGLSWAISCAGHASALFQWTLAAKEGGHAVELITVGNQNQCTRLIHDGAMQLQDLVTDNIQEPAKKLGAIAIDGLTKKTNGLYHQLPSKDSICQFGSDLWSKVPSRKDMKFW